MTRFHDLPYEVIDVIIGYIDDATLRELINYPKIGEQALRVLYASITIDDPVYSLIATDPLYKQHDTTVQSPTAFIDLLRSKPGIVVKKLIIKNPFHALELVHKYPEYLNDVKIELKLSQLKMPGEIVRSFAEEYMKSPFEVYSIETSYPILYDVIPWLELSRNVTSLYAFNDSLNSAIAETFPNLTFLRVDRISKVNEFLSLPSQLKVLHCNLEPVDGQMMRLQLPYGLSELGLNLLVDDGREHRDYTCDIGSAVNLETLELYSHYCLSNVVFSLPASLKRIYIEQVNMYVEDLATMCPNLITLETAGRKSPLRGYYDPCWTFPETMRRLGIPSNYFMRGDTPEDASIDKLTFPSRLWSLNVQGGYFDRKPVVLDFEKNQFQNLYSLKMNHVFDLEMKGNLPDTITQIALDRIPAFDLNQIEHLKNLTKLYIDCGEHKFEFAYKLPDSLKLLSLLNCKYSSVQLNCQKLEYLMLGGNDFPMLHERLLSIPDTVCTLYLSNNRTDVISPRFVFPSNLEFLDLSINNLTQVTNLPPHLKRLVLDHNSLGKEYAESCLPTELEFLSLSYNVFTPKWIQSLNLAACSNLQYLNLNENALDSLNLDYLPSSLIELALSRVSMTRFSGDFQRFPFLQKLDLSFNKLRGYFREMLETPGQLFGDSIQMVDVKGNDIRPEDARALLDKLTCRPHFERLFVEYGTTGNFLSRLGTIRSLSG
ncbi:hypothetical protein Cantr_04741 [Candida viswanathii]|uniref:Uncharacterized protein n=1 Tax=Candida viswanathii TaxID=5486 RepID=A0A367XM51_9ASCO|nr:hypothetical protein Cantr_04741 [Candida viswanathii]